MIKKQYLKEIKFPGAIKRDDNDNNVKHIQEWCNLLRFYDKNWNVRVEVDKDFGPASERMVKAFQAHHNLPITGIVDETTWDKFVEPMRFHFNAANNEAPISTRESIVWFAKSSLRFVPRELAGNRGPWVRAYMDGHEGPAWAWCCGYVQTMMDQAYSLNGKQFTDELKRTYSCDQVLEEALEKGQLLRNKDLRKDFSKVQAGDLFLVMKHAYDAVHVGIITKVNDDGTFSTIEGNTNDEGSREGFEVCKRIRNYQRQNIDVVMLKA